MRRRQWHPTPVLLPGESHGQRSLVGCSPWGCKESDMTEWLQFPFSLSCIGEGNGNPLQCSCLENPRDRGAWWAAVCGVAQSQTRLKRLSSSSSNIDEEVKNLSSSPWYVSSKALDNFVLSLYTCVPYSCLCQKIKLKYLINLLHLCGPSQFAAVLPHTTLDSLKSVSWH